MLKQTGLLALLALSAPTFAATSSSATLTVTEAEEELRRENQRLEQAFAELPKQYGADPIAELEQIRKAERALASVLNTIDSRHKIAGQTLNVVVSNAERLRRQVGAARKAQAVTVALHVVRNKHVKNEPASDGELAAIDDAVTAFEREAGTPAWAGTLSFFKGQAAQMRADRDNLVASIEQQRIDALDAQKNAALDAAMKEANAARRAIEAALVGTAGPAAPELFTDLLAAANKVTAIDVGAGQYYLRVRRNLEVASAFRGPVMETVGPEVARLLEGGMVTSGTANGKTVKVAFVAEQGWCYATVLRFAKDLGGENVSGLRYTAARRESALQRFHLDEVSAGYQRIDGICASQNVRVSAEAKVEKLGDNELRYVVVGWPRASFPTSLTTYLGVESLDGCDYENKKSLFLDPLPGSLVYRDAVPLVVTRASWIGQPSVEVMNLAGARSVVAKGELHEEAGEGGTPPVFAWNGCDIENATHDDTKALGACYAKVEQKFQGPMSKAEKAFDRAKSDADRDRAEAKINEVKANLEDAKSKTCEGLLRKLEADNRQAFEQVLDAYRQAPLKDSAKRATRLKGENRARPELR